MAFLALFLFDRFVSNLFSINHAVKSKPINVGAATKKSEMIIGNS